MTNFTYQWNLADLKKVKRNGLQVFSCFACGGGSSMGYKMAGCDVVGINEIDPKMCEVYDKNFHPTHLFQQDIQTFSAITIFGCSFFVKAIKSKNKSDIT